MVHKHSEQKNDRQRNSNQPKQHTFSKRHGNPHLINKRSDNAAAFHLFPWRNPLSRLVIRQPLLIWTRSTDSVFRGLSDSSAGANRCT